MREHWRELGFWRWWWRNRVPFAVKSVLAVLVLAGIVIGGWFAAQGLPSAKADDNSSATVVRTVQRTVTVRESGKVVVHRVRQVRTVFVANPAASTKTVHDTRTVVGAHTVVQTVSAPLVRTVVRTVAAPAAKPTPTRVRTVTRTVTHKVTRTKTVPKVVDHVITIIEQQKPVTVTVTVTTPSP
jgi:hypothetical protein